MRTRQFVAILSIASLALGMVAASANAEEVVSPVPSAPGALEALVTPEVPASSETAESTGPEYTVPPSLAPDSTDAFAYCEPGLVCSWSGVHGNGYPSKTLCSNEGNHVLGSLKKSVINGCSNRAIEVELNGASYVCMNANGERPTTEYNEIFVSSIGSYCS